MNSVQAQLFPAFLQSACFRLYASMLQFAFSRPVFSRDSFIWLKVREACHGSGWRRASARAWAWRRS
jgi:hypothetical protein